MSVNVLQAAFNKGELSPKLHARIDIEQWGSAYKEADNVMVVQEGGVMKRSGTKYIGEVKTSTSATRLIPFIFSQSQSYILEFGNLYIRFWTLDGQVEYLGSPYEVTTTYTAAEVGDISFAQSSDIIYLAHPDHAPAKLSRNSETDWTLEDVDFTNPPMLQNFVPKAKLTFSKSGNAVPVMTANSSPSGVCSGTPYAGTAAFYAFNEDVMERAVTASWPLKDTPQWYKYAFDAGDDRVVTSYAICGDTIKEYYNTQLLEWTFEGSTDDATWDVLDQRRGIASWEAGEVKVFPMVGQTTSYRYYRIQIYATTAANQYGSFGYLMLLEDPDSVDASDRITVTADSVTGINGGSGFTADDVGRQIMVHGATGHKHYFRIEARTSTTEVDVVAMNLPLASEEVVSNWTFAAFSENSGFPRAVSFYQERLAWASTSEEPLSIWFSKAGSLEDYGLSSPVIVDDDAISITLLSSQINEILWMAEGKDLYVGSRDGMRTVGPTERTSLFSPTNVSVKLRVKYGTSDAMPVFVGHILLFISKNKEDLREFFYSYEIDSYVSPELTVLSNHLLEGNVIEMDFQQHPNSTIWIVREDGTFLSLAYNRDQQVVGLGQHHIAGAVTGESLTHGKVESVAIIPKDDEDEIWMVVQRTIDSATERYVERLYRPFEKTTDNDIDNGKFLDSFLEYSGGATSTISGLGHLEGETVDVFSEGTTYTGLTVSSGSITLPGGATVTSAVVGLPYEAYVTTLPVSQGRDGPILGRRAQGFCHIANILNSGQIYRREDGTDHAVKNEDNSMWDDPAVLTTGNIRFSPDRSWRDGGELTLVSKTPHPMFIRAVSLEYEMEP